MPPRPSSSRSTYPGMSGGGGGGSARVGATADARVKVGPSVIPGTPAGSSGGRVGAYGSGSPDGPSGGGVAANGWASPGAGPVTRFGRFGLVFSAGVGSPPSRGSVSAIMLFRPGRGCPGTLLGWRRTNVGPAGGRRPGAIVPARPRAG